MLAWHQKLRALDCYQNATRKDPVFAGYDEVGNELLWFNGSEPGLWARSDLDRATVVAAHAQLRPLLSKLHAGQPITVVAYGSSITQDYGGAFHTGSCQALATRLGAESLPDWSWLYKEARGCCFGFADDEAPGWLAMFMQMVNATFPHPGHTVLNYGRSAYNLANFAHGACLSAHLPETLDLVVLESFEFIPGAELEALVWRLIRHYTSHGKQAPAFIHITSGAIMNAETSHQEEECLRDSSLCETSCGAPRPYVHDLAPLLFTEDMKQYEMLAVAQYYSFTHINHRQFLWSMLRDGAHVAMHARNNPTAHPQLGPAPMSACRFLAGIHSDNIHLDAMGRLLYADYLMNALVSAEEYLVQAQQTAAANVAGVSQTVPGAPNEAAGASDGTSNDAAAAAAAAASEGGQVPGAPNEAAGASDGTSNDAAAAAAAAASEGGQGELSGASRRSSRAVLQAATLVLPDQALYPEGRTITTNKCTSLVDATPGSGNSEAASQPLEPELAVALVVKAEGWRFSETQTSGAKRKHKPGWVASGPGSVIRIRLNTKFTFTEDTSNKTTVTVTYLRSYEHMGRAKAECISGCKCASQTIDALDSSHRVSVMATFDLVTAPPVDSCTIQVMVLKESSRKEHKFKIVQVMAKTSDTKWSVD
eukprot:CAMPEP_0202886252 /NCGR_PEP_ID=MMETSP1391-20130828/42080_1 /ASSEMBLY_ACC=CAM_ASM_000867 /TAXON_ID=1034604 /ORGANISM="Chlamydomonas leiostraca, Strain SAG 11-49" /LENGTH=649 /DNA_ID=CAMNT_0049569521 /DNA_START=113 /DNA_END=2062 /DNA_ORIENTATION=-